MSDWTQERSDELKRWATDEAETGPEPYVSAWLACREIERLKLADTAHGYAIEHLRMECGLPGGEDYSDVAKLVHRLQEQNRIMQEALERAVGVSESGHD